MSTNPKDLNFPRKAKLRSTSNDPGIAKLPGVPPNKSEKSDTKDTVEQIDLFDQAKAEKVSKDFAKETVLEAEIAKLKATLSKNTRRLRDAIYRLEAEGDVRWCEDCDTVYSVKDTCRCEDEDFPGLSDSERNS